MVFYVQTEDPDVEAGLKETRKKRESEDVDADPPVEVVYDLD